MLSDSRESGAQRSKLPGDSNPFSDAPPESLDTVLLYTATATAQHDGSLTIPRERNRTPALTIVSRSKLHKMHIARGWACRRRDTAPTWRPVPNHASVGGTSCPLSRQERGIGVRTTDPRTNYRTPPPLGG